MKDYRNKKYPEHDRTSCSDENLANAVPEGSGCRRCNALLFNRYEELLEEVQALQALQKDVERYRWLRLQRTIADYTCVTWNIGHDWVQMEGAELDAAIDHARRAEGGGE